MTQTSATVGGKSKDVRDRARPPASRTRLPQILIVLAGVLALWPLCTADFTTWDDPRTVSQNPTLNPPTLHSLWVWWTASNLDLWDPVTDMVRGVLAMIGRTDSPDPATGSKLNPYVYHSANLLIHIITALIIFQVLQLLLARVQKPSRTPIRWAACAGAILFLVHPLQVESVGWVTAMKDLLCGMFSVAGIWRYLIYAGCDMPQRQHVPTKYRPRRDRNFWIATFLFVLATLSKPTAVVVPAMLVVINWLVLKQPVRRYWRGLTLWTALSLPAVIITKIVQNPPPIEVVPFWKHLLSAADALAFYLYKLIWPARLTYDYGRTTQYVFERGFAWWTWAVPAAIAGMLWVLRKRCPVVPTGALIFVLGLLPVLGLVDFDFQQYSNVADHYLYLSMFGVALVASRVLQFIPARPAKFCVALLLVGLGARACLQTWTWQSSDALYRHALAENPVSFLSLHNLAVIDVTARRPEEAIRFEREAIELSPNRSQFHRTLADALTETGHAAEAIEEFRVGVSLTPDDAAAVDDLGRSLAYQRRYDEALLYFRQSCDIDPNFARSHRDLALLLSKRSPIDAAIPAFRAALRLSPDDAELHARFSAVLWKTGLPDEARREQEAALRLKAASESVPGESAAPTGKEQR